MLAATVEFGLPPEVVPELLLEVVPEPEEVELPEAAVEVAVEPTELVRLALELCVPPELPPGGKQSAPGKLPPSQPTRAKPS